ncbi:PAS domain-containing protein [Eubacterium aggregans]|uniref:PAS domain-containing protein n=1 Tax=Eubacterium aggregans TaxID=81409 RepID=UPI003F40EC45
MQVLESKTNIAAFVLPLLSAETRLIKAIRTHKIYAKALIVVSEEIIESSVKTNLYEQHIKTYISPLDDWTLNARILESAIDMYRRFMDQYNQMGLYRTIENGGTFTLLVNDEWKLLYANDKYYEFIGYTPESFQKLCTNSVKKITYPQDVAPLKQNIEAVLAKDEERFDTQARIVTHASEIKHCLIKSAFATRNDQTVINGILLDITKEMKTEQKLSALIENIPGGVAVVEISPNQTKPTYLSDGFFNLFGYKREEYLSLILDNSICRVHPDDTALVLKAIENSLKNNTAFNCTYRFKHKNGKYQWINFAASPVERLDDKSIYYGLYTDVSKEKEANLNLRKTNNRLNAIMENLDGGIVILKYEHEKIIPEFYSHGGQRA